MTKRHVLRPSRTGRAERGFVLAYALAAIFLLSLVVGLATRVNSIETNGLQMADVRDRLVSQASLIRAKLLTCAAMYPVSPNAIPWPAFPADSTAEVKDLLCPGAPSGVQGLWLTDDALGAPVTPAGFGPWIYKRDGSNVITISTSLLSSSAFLVAGARNAAVRFGESATFDGTTFVLRIN